MKRIIAALFMFAATTAAQISEPLAGHVRDRAGSLRPVLGIAGGFVLGEAIHEGVLSSGFGRSTGYAKTASEILVFRNGELSKRVPAPAGSALYYTGNAGEITHIYFPAAQELWSIRDSVFEKQLNAPVPLSSIEFEACEITLTDRTRLMLPEPIQAVEWVSNEWIVARGESALYASRLNGRSAAVQLPEAAR